MAKRIPWLVCVSLVVVSGLSAEEPALLHTFSGRGNSADTFVFSQNGRTLISGGLDGAIVFWDVSTGESIAKCREHSSVEGLALLSKQSNISVSAGSPPVYSTNEIPAPPIILWDVAKREKVATLGDVVHGLVMSMAVSPNGTCIALGVLSTDFVGDPFRVDLWDTKSHKKTITLPSEDSPSSLAFSPDGTVLAIPGCDLGGWANVKLSNVADGKQIAILKGHTDSVNKVLFSPDGKLLVTCSCEDETIRFWNTRTYKAEAILKRQDGIAPRTIAFDPNGKILASGHEGGIVTLWDVTTRKRITDFKANSYSVWCLAFSPDGKTLASSAATRKGIIKLWDIASFVETLGSKKAPVKTAGE